MLLTGREQERFWSFVSIPRRGDGSRDESLPWMWTGAVSRDGHGRFWLRGRHELAHRVSFLLHHGFLPDIVCHIEPVPGNINPHHLYAGTALTNVEDRQRQGRQANGARNGRACLSETDVVLARVEIQKGGTTLAAIARRLGVHKTTLRAAVYGKTWRHLGISGDGDASALPERIVEALPQGVV